MPATGLLSQKAIIHEVEPTVACPPEGGGLAKGLSQTLPAFPVYSGHAELTPIIPFAKRANHELPAIGRDRLTDVAGSERIGDDED